MQFRPVLVPVAAAMVLAGCSHSASVPDYHTLIPTAPGAAAQAKLAQAKEKCAEAATPAAAMANAWCGVADKANRCIASLRWKSPGPGSDALWVEPADLAAVEANPTADCPAK